MSGAWRIRLGAVLLLLATAGMLFLFGPASFADRLSGRVDVEGTVQWGVSMESVAGDDLIPGGEYGAWKVDYQIDGTMHTGMIVGRYHEGQRIMIAAPSDGSFYSLLREGTPTSLKVLSWFVAPVTVVAIVLGTWWVIQGGRERDAQNRLQARQQLARHYPQLFAAPQPTTAAVPPVAPAPRADAVQLAPPSHQRRPDGPSQPDFFAPYDI